MINYRFAIDIIGSQIDARAIVDNLNIDEDDLEQCLNCDFFEETVCSI
jgi:hypothetical protein